MKIDLAAGDQRKPEYLAINPHGKVPALVIDGVPMFESLAMLLFLGERFGVARNLWLTHDHHEYPTALSWMTFSNNVFRYLLNTSARFPKDAQNAAAAEAARQDVLANLSVLDNFLADCDYLVADHHRDGGLNGLATTGRAVASKRCNVRHHPTRARGALLS